MAFSALRTCYFICVLLCFCQAFSAHGMPDTLAKYTYLDLDNFIYENRRDSLKRSVYMDYYLQKAQREKNIGRLALYYSDYVFYEKEGDRLPFIDTALHYAYQTKDTALIGMIYLTKATVYHSFKDYQQTLTHYLKANEYIAQTDDTYNMYRIKNHIAVLKNYLGYYEEAEAFFAECADYYGREENNYNMHRGYISSLEGLAWSYTKTGRIAESAALLSTGLASVRRTNFSELDEQYLVFKQGINDYYMGKYDSAVHKIEQMLPFVYENEDFAWATIGEFYIGKAYWDRGDKEKAITYFQKMDEVFLAKNYTHPDLREGYELLINYYKAQDDKDKQITYSGQLVRADSVYHQTHRHLLNRIHKEYSTKELLDTKKTLETALYIQKNKTNLVVIGSVLALLLVFAIMYYQKRKAKKLAQELIQEIKMLQTRPPAPTMAPAVAVKEPKKPTQLKDDVVEQLLGQLHKFEQEQRFLKTNISLESLAMSFGTNTKYLSSVINTYKQRSFPEYLNGLRVDYVVNDMVKNPNSVLFKYSIDALATHIGYSNGPAFSRAFVARTGVKPSVFIREVRKGDDTLSDVA